MRIIGFREEEMTALWQLVASILKLGNIQFSPRTNADNTDGCDLANPKGSSEWNGGGGELITVRYRIQLCC